MRYVPPEIFVVSLGDDRPFLVCNPLLNIFSLVNKSAVAMLGQYLQELDNPKSLPEELLYLTGLLTEMPENKPDDINRPFSPMFLGIVPSRACNLQCRYCDFGSDESQHNTMELQMAGEVVRWYARFLDRNNQSRMEIHFFGGEPFMARELVETVVHTGRYVAGQYDLVPHFEVSTNGNFDPDYAWFVGDYFDAVVLSLDGFKKSHDRQRPISESKGSFDLVCQTAKVLSQSRTDLCLRCCVTKENVKQLSKITDWFCREFHPSVINFEPLNPNAKTEVAGILRPDPYDFAVHCFAAQQRGREFGVPVVYGASETDTLRSSFCPVGRDALIVTPDGRVSSCYLRESEWQKQGLNLTVGKVGADGEIKVDHNAAMNLRALVHNKPKCTNCYCRWTCAGGCHVRNTWPDCPMDYDDFCIQTRLLTICKWLIDMGLADLAVGLMADEQAMISVATRKSDRLEDFA